MPVLETFSLSLLIGLSIAAPVGPIGLLVIQRSLNHGPRAGFAAGFGAATADALYGALGAWGAQGLMQALLSLRLPFTVAGAAFLLVLAGRLLRARPAQSMTDPAPPRAAWREGVGTLLLTLSNPATMLSFMAIFTALPGALAPGAPAAMVAGVFLGSALWWLLLSQLVGRLHGRFEARIQRHINLASALVLAGFALASLATLMR